MEKLPYLESILVWHKQRCLQSTQQFLFPLLALLHVDDTPNKHANEEGQGTSGEASQATLKNWQGQPFSD
eukprot:1157799-Pelagomonas_calceolata.AAC.8